MNMFWHELRAYRKSTLIWTATLVAVVVLMFSMYPAFVRDADQFLKVLEGMPKEMLQAIGLDPHTFTSILGFYGYIFTYIVLCGAIQAMNLGVSIVSKEMREKTADFLLTKPVTRRGILTAKLAAAVLSLTVTWVIYTATALLMAMSVRVASFSLGAFLLVSFSLWMVQLMFFALGVVLSVSLRKIRAVLPISLGTVFAFFFIGMLGATAGDTAMRYVTPFKYFESAYIAQHVAYETSFVVVAGCCVVAAMVASYIIYTRKDIHAV